MLNEQKVHSILLGRKVRVYYKLPEYESQNELAKDLETISRVKIGEYDLPILSVGDEVFLSDQEVYATVQKVTHGTDGHMYYNVSYVTEYVDDLESTKEELTPILQQRYAEYCKQKEKEAEEKRLEDDKYEKFREKVQQRDQWQQSNLDKIKGIIVCNPPLNEQGKVVFSQSVQKHIINDILSTIPKEFIVLVTPYNISYADFTNGQITFQSKEIK